MKTFAALTALALAGALSSPTLAGAEGPGSPPPETGIVTPQNGERDAAPDEYPSASVIRARCAGQRTQPVLENGAAIPGPASDSTQEVSDPPGRSEQGPAMSEIINGAAVPTRSSAVNDPTWCEGAYRPDAGSNFGE